MTVMDRFLQKTDATDFGQFNTGWPEPVKPGKPKNYFISALMQDSFDCDYGFNAGFNGIV